MIPQSVLQLAQFCKEVGLFHVVVSPGSRSAPLVLALSRIGGIEFHPVMDERSAGYTALGMALAIQKPVALLCTSGTAVLNYGPATAEAFYQQVPLFVITADRPPESIDQNEGQAIRQNGLFQNHTKFWATMPSTDESEAGQILAKRWLNQAFLSCIEYPKGPVHLNFPLREPLYPTEDIDFRKFANRRISVQSTQIQFNPDRLEINRLIEIFNQTPKRLLVVGQHETDPELTNSLKAVSEYGNAPILGDILHNLKEIPRLVFHTDWFQSSFLESDESKPDLVITVGLGLLSKPLKRFLADIKPKYHWHICPSGFPADASGSITELIHADPTYVLSKLAEGVYFQGDASKQSASQYEERWLAEESKVKEKLVPEIEKQPWCDATAVHYLVKQLPKASILFAGNSMPVRYLSWMSPYFKSEQFIFANRGTSGIDGCISTAVGLARMKPDQPVIAVVGDISFFYDRNGLWGSPVPPNLKIAVLNNAGGNIFRIIPGSGSVPELENLFELHQPLSAERTALDAEMAYFRLDSEAECEMVIKAWLSDQKAALLECVTNKYVNAEVVKDLKMKIV